MAVAQGGRQKGKGDKPQLEISDGSAGAEERPELGEVNRRQEKLQSRNPREAERKLKQQRQSLRETIHASGGRNCVHAPHRLPVSRRQG